MDVNSSELQHFLSVSTFISLYIFFCLEKENYSYENWGFVICIYRDMISIWFFLFYMASDVLFTPVRIAMGGCKFFFLKIGIIFPV